MNNNKTAWIGAELLSEIHDVLYCDIHKPDTATAVYCAITLMKLANSGTINMTLLDSKNPANSHTIRSAAMKWVCAPDCEGNCNHECDGHLDYDQVELFKIHDRIMEGNVSLFATIDDKKLAARKKKRAKEQR